MGDQNGQLVVSYLTLRQMIGWIGLLMPLAVRVGAYVFEGVYSTDSISAYYYTSMRDVFVSTLVLVGVLLTCYRSPDPRDNVVAIVAGIGAVMLGAFIAIGVLAFTMKGASIFWPETFAVVAFAVAWLVKGRTILKDPAQTSDA